jgi:thiamine biosynthesis lipoprotein
MVALLLLLAAQAAAPADSAARVERRLAAMGTWLALEVGGAERATALRASEAAARAIEECEARLSTWRGDSELARLNACPVGEPFELSRELADDLARAAALWRATEGAFDPGLGALVEAWGLRTGGRQPSLDELRAAREAHGFSGIEVVERRAFRRHALARVEEGGFGKGLGLDLALAALRRAGGAQAALDFGGQWLVWRSARELVVADPDDREHAVLALTIDSGSLATSGNSERGILVAGERRGHLLDPRRGEPAADFGSLTVWAPDALTADALSTGLYVMGPERAFAWQAQQGAQGIACEVLVLQRTPEGLRVRLTAGLVPVVRVLDHGRLLEVSTITPDTQCSPK